jgi:hypothetical protein
VRPTRPLQGNSIRSASFLLEVVSCLRLAHAHVFVALLCHINVVPFLGPGLHQPYRNALGVATGGLMVSVHLLQPILFLAACLQTPALSSCLWECACVRVCPCMRRISTCPALYSVGPCRKLSAPCPSSSSPCTHLGLYLKIMPHRRCNLFCFVVLP